MVSSPSYDLRWAVNNSTPAVGLSITMICIDIMNIFAGPTTLSEPVLHPLLCLECFAGRRRSVTLRPVGVIADPTTLAGEQPDSSSASTSPAIHPTAIVGVGCSQSSPCLQALPGCCPGCRHQTTAPRRQHRTRAYDRLSDSPHISHCLEEQL